MAKNQAILVSLVAFILLQSTSAVTATFRRRILHHPLFPLDSPAPAQQPNATAHSPKHTKPNATSHHSPPTPSAHPLSATPAAVGGGSAAPAAAATTTDPGSPFFPNYPSLSPPPPPPAAASSSGGESTLPTFPANISSLVVPHSRSSSSHHSATSPKLIALTVVLCLAAVSLFASFFLLRRHRRRHHDRSPLHPFFKHPHPPPDQTPNSDNAVLYPPYASTSDGRPPKLPLRSGATTNSSEFLYIGTLAASNSTEFEPSHHENQYQSPEIRPLPPLRPLHNHNHLRNSDSDATDVTDSDEFYSPVNSSGRIEFTRSSSTKRASEEALARIEGLQIQSKSKIPNFSSYPNSNSSSPGNSARSGPSVLVISASDSSNSCSPEYIMRPPPVIHRAPPPPPPPPPAMGRAPLSQPPVLPQPSRSFKSGEQQQNPQAQPWNRDANERNDEIRKPKLKGLHWDKVRASSDRVTVWDQLEAGSFALNEEMMETLFTANAATNMGGKDLPRRPMMQMMNQEYRVLDPKKSQNIAILLRALNVTVEEVCDSLLEGNADMLGTELLESLLKMTPTEEEERNLREYKDESPLKLGPAEKFLKAVLDIPFAFKRVNAMLYMANFDSEAEHLKRSFEALEVACGELRNSRMFLKLLEAVLKTGNRMNIGTNRGDAQAFKLDTLLKLVDVKGTDGKTTLLHFVVQEMIKSEGHSKTASSSLQDDMETKKRGLQIVSGLCGELMNVKKAAAMDSDVLANDVHKLVQGIVKVEEVARLNEEIGLPNDSHRTRFADSMCRFIKKASGEIGKIQELQTGSLLKVKELTEYFHGNSAKEEAHRLRIFMVVRDFLSILDKACKEVAKVNERTIISSNWNCSMPVNPNLPQLFPDHSNGERRDEESESSS